MKIDLRDRLLASTIIAGIVVAAAPAQAQTAAQTDGQTTSSVVPAASPQANIPATGGTDAPTGSEIVVTGSRIPQPNLTSASPVTVLNSQEAKLQGTTRVEDLINSLPQAFAAQNSAVSNGSSGTATLNLRNLGAQRTLVLINGRRLQPGDPSTPFPDVNIIPASLIKRVDVLTGGASSVYGSDAVAGVVNFILDTDYSGFGVDSQYAFFQHGNRDTYQQSINAAAGFSAPAGNAVDGRQIDVTAKFGAGFDDNRGHLVGYVGYRKVNAVDQSSRDYSNCGLTGTGDGGFACSGSLTSFPAVLTRGIGGRYQVGPNGTLNSSPVPYNANPFNYYQRPDKRYVAGFMGHYDVADAFKPYVEFNFMDDRTNAVIAPSGDFGNTSTINCDNPYLSAAQGAILCTPANLVTNVDGDPASGVKVFRNPDGSTYNRANVVAGRRNVEGGGRDADLRHTDYRIVVGAKGDIARGISYDGSFQYGATEYNEIYRNEYSVSRVTKAIDVVNGPNGPTCRSVVDGSDLACKPFNIFGTGQASGDLLNYLEVPGFQSGENIEKVVNGSITVLGSEYGVQSPWSDQGIGLNFGGEYRSESTRLEVDNSFATGDLAGQGGPALPFKGSFDVKEAFVELQVPLVSDKPFFHSLTIDGGYRYSDYSTAGSVSAYKGQVTWSPIRDITFRGGYNRAVRAPNVLELFKSRSVQIDGATDPCAGATPTFTQEQCVLLHVPTDRYGTIPDNPSAQYNGYVGGTPTLTPEKADTYTVGIILQPSFLRGFSATVDAFQIKVKNVINYNAASGAGIGADLILNQCGRTGLAQFCDAIHRDAFGSLTLTPQGFVEDPIANAGYLKTRGIDANVNYTLRTDSLGTFGLSFNGTYLDEFRRNVIGADYDCAGLYGAICGIPAPKWRHKARLSWDLPMGLGLSAQWRYYGHSRLDAASSDVDLAGSFDPADTKIKAYSFIDLVATAKIGDHYSLRAGVNNVADKQPPLLSQDAAPIGSFGNGNTYPTVYDALGRYIFVGVSLNL